MEEGPPLRHVGDHPICVDRTRSVTRTSARSALQAALRLRTAEGERRRRDRRRRMAECEAQNAPLRLLEERRRARCSFVARTSWAFRALALPA
jgi:hypothetical protein